MAWSSGLQIRVLEGKDKGRLIPLDGRELTLGRALSPDEKAPGWILFTEPTVSRIHAILTWDDRNRRYNLQHRSRTNPTLVDGKPVEKRAVGDGCRIQMGLLVCQLESVDKKAQPRGGAAAPRGRLGDAVTEPRPASLIGPVMEALSTLAEEKRREEPPPATAPPAPPPGRPEPTPAGAAPTPAASPLPPRRGRHETPLGSPSGLRLVVAQGPDMGSNYPLHDPVLVIGRSLGINDTRIGHGVLLSDESLPEEQALLVWQEREQTYSILQAEATEVPIRIRRVVNGNPREIPVSTEAPTLLEENDVLQMGSTTLVLRRSEPSARAEPRPRRLAASEGQGLLRGPAGTDEGPRPSPASPFRSGRAAAEAEAAPERPPEKCIPAPRSREKAPPPPAPQEEPSGEAGAAPPAPAAQTPRPEPVLAEPGPRAEKRLTLEPRAPSSGEGGGVVPRGVPPQPSPEEAGGVVPRGVPPHLTRRGSGPPSSLPLSLDEAPAELGAVTFPWKFRSDYVFGFLEGKHKGSKISLLASELSDDRIITLGSPGERLNDIEVEDPRVANDQAFLRFRGGRFTLVNQRADNVVFVNNLALKEGDQVVLMTGDRLEIGDTVLVFMERRVVDILQCYDLEVLNGVGNDVGRTFELTKERMLVGRGRNCDVRLSDLEISRVHAVLVHRDGRFYVQHRSETNPTFVNGISLLPGAERMITPDDRIQLSSHTVLRFRQRKP